MVNFKLFNILLKLVCHLHWTFAFAFALSMCETVRVPTKEQIHVEKWTEREEINWNSKCHVSLHLQFSRIFLDLIATFIITNHKLYVLLNFIIYKYFYFVIDDDERRYHKKKNELRFDTFAYVRRPFLPFFVFMHKVFFLFSRYYLLPSIFSFHKNLIFAFV